MFTPNELKKELQNLGVVVYPDMKSPVSMVDEQTVIEAKIKKFHPDISAKEMAQILSQDKNFAFYQIFENLLRYASWN